MSINATTMSNRLFCCLNEATRKGGFSLERMLEMSQTTVGNVIRRGYLKWDGEVFAVTPLGEEVRKQFDKTDIDRIALFRPLSSLIKEREVHKLVESQRKELKHEYDSLQRATKESEGDKVKRQKVKMKTNPGNGQRKSAA